MLRTLLLLPTAALLAFGACNTTKTAAQDDRFGGTGAADSLFFSIKRTPCFGKCPVYQINVYRSGYATYTGTNNTDLLGDHVGHIGADTLALLLNKAEALGFFGLQDKYDGQVTDLPSTIVRVVSKDRNKQVLGRVKAPQAFKDLVLYAEELLLKAPWKPLETQR
ncbi:MAG: DUF6438 domain-containing protein [Flavobacteriales bacterium]